MPARKSKPLIRPRPYTSRTLPSPWPSPHSRPSGQQSEVGGSCRSHPVAESLGFCGVLDRFESYLPSQQKQGVVIAIEGITCLQNLPLRASTFRSSPPVVCTSQSDRLRTISNSYGVKYGLAFFNCVRNQGRAFFLLGFVWFHLYHIPMFALCIFQSEFAKSKESKWIGGCVVCLRAFNF
ncbi:hypothetical protein EDB85DRAFT_346376 [Lactarius pseudohatsudake]|nr:hypothetical protein EDB85DRAFT_346376 [Lactarius pseudohatsudake]